jgi:single-stranded-DNA-specific exonuclease
MSDMDGFTSASMMYLYLKKVNPSLCIDYFLHTGKQHGLADMMDRILNAEIVPDLVIIPDAASNDYEFHRVLKEKNIDVVLADHHECDQGYSESAIVVNNQLSEQYPNKSLCGAGVVYKLLCCLDDLLNVHYADEFIDLAAVGEIGDMMEVTNLETRYIINTGLNNISNLGLTAFFDKQAYSMGNKINPTTVAFYIVPLFNAVIRVGTQEEKEILFKSLITPMETVPSTKRGHKPRRYRNIMPTGCAHSDKRKK